MGAPKKSFICRRIASLESGNNNTKKIKQKNIQIKMIKYGSLIDRLEKLQKKTINILLNCRYINVKALSESYFRRFTIISGCRVGAPKKSFICRRIASLESGDNNTKKKSTRNIQIKRSKLMNYGLWIVDRSIGKTSERQ